MHAILVIASLLTAASAQLFTSSAKPTYRQVERLIATVQEANGESVDWPYVQTNRTVYSSPTYSQVERLIGAVRSGTNTACDVAGARYLSIWDCTTGLPLSNRTSVVYRPGDVYVVGNSYHTDMTNSLYVHRVLLEGYTQGDGVPYSYTNCVFSFTNTVATAYTDFSNVVSAASDVASGKKDAFFAESGVIVTEEGDDLPIVTLDPEKSAMHVIFGNGIHSYASIGTATNATRIVDTVTAVPVTPSGTNYRPSYPQYVDGVASTIVERSPVNPNDTYWYDGVAWRLIASSGGGGSADLSSRTTFAEATNIAYHVVTNGVSDWALTGKTAPITGITINSQTLTVDPSTRTASGTIATCGPFPTGWRNHTTTKLFCESIALSMDASKKSGVMYMGTVTLADEGEDTPQQCEAVVTVVADNRTNISDTDTEDFRGAVILKVEATTTNNGMRHWMTMYEKFGRKSIYEYGRWPHGKISYGTDSSPWLGMLFKPLDNQAGAEEAIDEDKNIAASLQDLKDAISGSNADFSNAVMSVKRGIDTNTVEQINSMLGDMGATPIGEVTTIGSLLAALAAAVAWLKKNKMDKKPLAGREFDASDVQGIMAAAITVLEEFGATVKNKP